MRKFAFGFVAVLALAGAAHAEGDPMAGAYGNTVSVIYPDGNIDTLYISQDGTYKAASPTRGDSSGTWAVADGQTCFTQTAPAVDAPPSCSPTVEGKGPGDSWDSVGLGGVAVTVRIDAGY